MPSLIRLLIVLIVLAGLGALLVLGVGLSGCERELAAKRPWRHWLMHRVLRLLMNDHKRARLAQRLFERARTSETFIANNRYLLIRLAQA